MTLPTRGTSRLTSSTRLAGIDIARAIALIGMVAAHTANAPALALTEPDTWLGIVDGRSSILFATVAGVSIAFMSGGVRVPIGDELVAARLRIIVRALLVFAIGSLLQLVASPIAIILEYYAVCMVLSAIVLNRSVRFLVIATAVTAVVSPFLLRVLVGIIEQLPGYSSLAELVVSGVYPVLIWMTFFLAGMAIGRSRLTDRRVLMMTGLIGAVLAVVGYALGAVAPDRFAAHEVELGSPTWGDVLSAAPHSGGLAEVIGSGGVAIAVIAACTLLPHGVQFALGPLRALGSMPLTIYVLHALSLAILVVLGLDPNGAIVFWVTVVGALLLSMIWRTFVGRGPLEALVASVTRRTAHTTNQ